MFSRDVTDVVVRIIWGKSRSEYISMEELYSTLLPHGRAHCMTWSGTNLVAVSLSEELPDSVTENKERFQQQLCLKITPIPTYFRMKTNYLAVFDPDRPWIFHK